MTLCLAVLLRFGTQFTSNETMFERTLQDLIRGLRAHKASSKAQEDAFLQEAMLEIREELKGKDMALKAEGILKVCYVSVPTGVEAEVWLIE